MLDGARTSPDGFASSSFVWHTYANETGFLATENVHTVTPYVCALGLLYSCFAFSGYEAARYPNLHDMLDLVRS